MDELDDLFERAEQSAVAHDWNRRTRMLQLFDRSTCIGNDELHDDIAHGEMSDEDERRIMTTLLINQTRPIDRPAWGKLELAKWMRTIWNLKKTDK